MKIKLLIITIGLTIISCSGGKEIASKRSQNSSSVRNQVVMSKKPTFSKEVNYKINAIIQSYLGVSMSSIARSDVKKTNDGYQWKFMNVKTGQNYIANSNSSFSTVKIQKNQKVSVITYN